MITKHHRPTSQQTLFDPQLACSTAVFSDCLRYRYRLERVWRRSESDQLRTMLWIMLNPSTADEIANDPTVERCARRALRMGYNRLLVGNIFALRSTDPQRLIMVEDPVGEDDNDRFLVEMASEADLIVCGWGNHGCLSKRGYRVRDLLRSEGHRLHALRITGQRQPQHPLYVSYDTEPTAWED